jgi:hypothetical protein
MQMQMGVCATMWSCVDAVTVVPERKHDYVMQNIFSGNNKRWAAFARFFVLFKFGLSESLGYAHPSFFTSDIRAHSPLMAESSK